MPPRIPVFDFDTMHEVVGFGHILPPLGETNEYGIEIHFAEVASTQTYALGLTMETRRIGCGQIGWTPIGSRWMAGQSVGQRRRQRSHFGKLTWRKTETLGAFLERPEVSGFSLARDMTCWLMKFDSAEQDLPWVVVPVAEVIRVLFGVSSAFLVQLFGGLRSPDIEPDIAFYDRGLSMRLEGMSYRLACTRDPSDMEAVMAAWVLSEETMLRAHDSVNQHRDVTTDKKGAATIGMAPPLKALEGSWTFEGARLPVLREVDGKPVRSRSTFLVSRILAIPVAPFFETLQITHHAVARGTGNPPTGARIRVPPLPPIPRMQEQTPAGTGHGTLEEAMEGALLEPAHAIEILRLLAPPGGPPAPLTLVGEDGREDEGRRREQEASTGTRQSGGGASLLIGRRRRDLFGAVEATDGRAESRQATWLAAFDMAIAERWALLHGGADEDDAPYLEKAFVGRRSFPVLVVCVRTGRGDVVVADAGTGDAEGRSLGLLVRSDRAPFEPDRDLSAVLGFAAATGAHWGTTNKHLDGFAVLGVNRVPSGIWRKRADYRALIRRNVDEVLRRIGAVIPAPPP